MHIDLDHVTPETLTRGCVEEDGAYTCVVCGKAFREGEIYPVGERLLDARHAAAAHAREEQERRFCGLLALADKLTENQKALLALIREGFSDREIAARMGVAQSTVRNQRFQFRERAKAARVMLALWEMATEEKMEPAEQTLVPVHEGAKMVDDRFVITEAEEKKILASVFESMEPLRLKVFSAKEKKKVVTLRRIAEEFERGRHYTEPDVNEILEAIYEDYVTLRRYLVEYGYMGRTRDCSDYWRV
ncbi:MAG: DUF2087 domain-containing protein [Clostridiaceae bacterium]|nr:DUF2087 domain-containing protein [Clostridiaceae bacterium]